MAVFEQVQNVFRAVGSPQCDESMVGVGERPAAADRDQARVTDRREDHETSMPGPRRATSACCDNRDVEKPAWPSTAEALMRSRFKAFRDADADWLLASWHPSTRPPSIDLSDNPKWRGLQIVDVVGGTEHDVTGVVEFRATYLASPGEVGALHERSRFVREDGRWYYLDGETS